MSSIPKTRIRIQADLFSFSAFRDVLRDDEDFRPKFRAGDDVQFEIAFFNNGSLLNVSDIASVTLEIKPLDEALLERYEDDDDFDNHDLRGPDLDLTPIRSKTLPYSALNSHLSQTDWETAEAQHAHAIITLDTRESNIAAGDRWLTISIVTTDTPSQVRTVCAGPIRVLGGGLSQAESPSSESPESYYTADEADARFMRMSENLADLRDTDAARSNLQLGESDTPEFAGLTIAAGGSVNLNGNRLSGVGDAATATDALNRQSADTRYILRDEADSISGGSLPAFPPALWQSGNATSRVALPAAINDALRSSFSLSLCVWLADDRPADYAYFFGNDSGAGHVTLRLNADGSLTASLDNGATEGGTLSGDPIFAAGASTRPHWLTLRVDRVTRTAQLYVDGTAYGTAYDTSGLNLDSATFGQPVIGARGSNAYRPLAFYLLDFSLENRALPAAEIAARFGPKPTAPVVSPTNPWGKPEYRYVSDFSSESYTEHTATTGEYSVVDGVTDGTNSYDNVLKVTKYASASTGAVRITLDNLSLSPNTADKQWRVEFDLFVPVAASYPSTRDIVFYQTGTGTTIGGVSYVDGVPGEWTHIVAEGPYLVQTGSAPATNLTLGFGLYSSGEDLDYYVANLTVQEIGCVAYYSAAQSTRAGDQLHDLSGNADDALITYGQWTEPTARDFYRARNVDTSTALYLGRAGDILPANAVVTSIIIDGTVYPITTTQPTDRRRIRLVPNGADLDVQRSDGTSHTTLVSAAPVADLSAVSLIINYQLY